MKTDPAILCRALALLACGTIFPAFAGNTWDGGGGNNLWSTNANWNFDTAPGYGTLVFDGAVQTTNVIDSIVSMNQVNWNGAMPWVLNSSGAGHLMLYDNGGTQAKLENFSSVAVTINAPITFAATAGANFGEINAVTGSMNFTGGTLTVNGSAVNGIKFWGGGGNDVSFANTVNASGKWFGFTSTNSQSVTIASGANVTTGDWYVMNGGTLKLAGGTLTPSAIRLGGDFGTTGNQNQTLGGTLALTAPTGGINFNGPINAVGGNTSNALLISSQNATGTNTLTGGIFLDSDLKIQQMPGAALTTSTGTFDIKNRKLTVDAGAMSTVTISQALTSSLAAGGSLVKEGNGTLVLSSTSNNYTGTSTATLNVNGTRIAAGTLAIAGDRSLGLVPSSAYNNLQFTGSGTLRADAAVTLSGNRNVSVASGQTATFDNNGNTLRINGIINGDGGIAATGAGTVTLAANNTYSGTTTINAGTLQLGSGGISGTLGSGALTNNGTLAVNRGDTVTFITDIPGTGGFEQMGPGTTVFIGSKGYQGNTVISGGTLQIGSGGTFGQAGLGSITNNGTLALSYTGVAGLFTQTVSGSGTLAKTGSGSVQINGVSNSFSGLTTVSAGTLEVMTDNAMGSTTTGTVVQSGATLWLKNNYSAAEPLTLNGTGDGGAGALRASSGYNVSYAGPITAATDATISVTDSLTLTGGLVNNGNT
jgi:autotransporter-associated beta strand protein